jgi:hypothetical protein
MLIDAKNCQWADGNVTIRKLIYWLREHTALLFDLMLIDAKNFQWADENVAIIKFIYWWRKHTTLLFDLMDIMRMTESCLLVK